jgi:hypothetical protein
MAIFSKPIDKGIPAILRRQSVDSTEISSGDIIDVKTLLGNSASQQMALGLQQICHTSILVMRLFIFIKPWILFHFRQIIKVNMLS